MEFDTSTIAGRARKHLAAHPEDLSLSASQLAAKIGEPAEHRGAVGFALYTTRHPRRDRDRKRRARMDGHESRRRVRAFLDHRPGEQHTAEEISDQTGVPRKTVEAILREIFGPVAHGGPRPRGVAVRRTDVAVPPPPPPAPEPAPAVPEANGYDLRELLPARQAPPPIPEGWLMIEPGLHTSNATNVARGHDGQLYELRRV